MIENVLHRMPSLQRTHYVLAALLAFQAFCALLFLVDFRIPFALMLAVAGVAVAVEKPLIGLGVLIAGRLTSTGANAWIRVGGMAIDLFEPALMTVLGALFVWSALHKRSLLVPAPWRQPVALLLALEFVSLLWSHDKGEGVKEVINTAIFLSTTLAILAFSQSWKEIRFLLLVWVGASLFISGASFLGLGADESTQFEMAQTNRASGFGQQPNWFAMNLMYGVLLCFGLGVMEKNTLMKVGLYLSGVFIFLVQMQSGSRGGTGALLIGGGIVALAEPRFRRVAVPIAVVGALIVGSVIFFELGDHSSAYARIFSSSSAVMGKSVRVSNWEACWGMFRDTWGLGIGAGGYEMLLPHYDYYISTTQYTYPHGIFWGIMAHYGVIGVTLWAWFLLVLARMSWDLVTWTKGTEYRVISWCMIATMVGYFAWSWVEFSYYEKPFWEYLGLYTALWYVARQRKLDDDAVLPASPAK